MEYKKIANSFGGEIKSESSIHLQLSFNSMVNAAKAADALEELGESCARPIQVSDGSFVVIIYKSSLK